MRLTPEQHTTVSSPNELRPPVLQTTNSAMLESAVLVNGRVDDTTGQTSNAEQNLEAEQAETQTPASDAANVDTLDGLNADKTEETNAGTQEKQEDRGIVCKLFFIFSINLPDTVRLESLQKFKISHVKCVAIFFQMNNPFRQLKSEAGESGLFW